MNFNGIGGLKSSEAGFVVPPEITVLSSVNRDSNIDNSASKNIGSTMENLEPNRTVVPIKITPPPPRFVQEGAPMPTAKPGAVRFTVLGSSKKISDKTIRRL